MKLSSGIWPCFLKEVPLGWSCLEKYVETKDLLGAAGLGYGTRVIDVRATAGGSGSVSSGESYTEDSMLDINGDGRLNVADAASLCRIIFQG